jgi:dynein heavy chain 1, cytosolic
MFTVLTSAVPLLCLHHITLHRTNLCAQTEVATLQRGLEAKEIQLHDKNALANAKLQQMLADQTVAERRKHEAEELSVVLEAQNARCATQRAAAQLQLSAAEPALLAAQASVRSIKKAQLDEIR